MTGHSAGLARVICALAFPGGGSVEMADGDGEGIGGVGGLGNLIEVEQARHHLLDLMFFSAAVAHDRGFDGEGRVLGDFEPGGGGGQHGDSAHLAEFQGGFHVGSVENIFDGDTVGTVLGDEFLKTDGNAREARRHGIARGNFDGAADDADEAVVIAVIQEQVDNTVAGIFGAAVDAEDAHEGSVAGGRLALSCQLSA